MRNKAKPRRFSAGFWKASFVEACLDTNTAGAIHNPAALLCVGSLICVSGCPAQVGVGADLPAPIVVRRPPFTDVFHVTEAAQADFMLIQPTQADAR
jgi:hypothetical protein